jgi:Flp pilus assembly protein TadD
MCALTGQVNATLNKTGNNSPIAWGRRTMRVLMIALVICAAAAASGCKVIRESVASAYIDKGNQLFKKNQWDEAEKQYRLAVSIDPDMAEAHSNLGMVMKFKGQTDAAIAEFRQAIRLKKDFAIAHFNLGAALALKEDYDGADVELREAIRENPGDGEYHHILGIVLEQKGDLEGAAQEYRKALALNPYLPLVADFLSSVEAKLAKTPPKR